MQTVSEERGQRQVPKKIHFIWAGGLILMKDDLLPIVAQWCKLNPKCDVTLWVDQNSAGGMEVLTEKYSELFRTHGLPVLSEASAEMSQKSCLILQDIGEFRDKLYLHEVNQIEPNYGCSSDMLRLRILERYGGCYFDQDVAPNPKLPLQDSDVFKRRDKHVIMLEHRPQRPAPEKPYEYISGGSVVYHGSSQEDGASDHAEETHESLSDDAAHESSSPGREPSKADSSSDNTYNRFFTLAFDELGNDAIITTAGNPLIKAMLGKIEANYQLDNSRQERIIEECYGGKNRRDRTINRTGPTIQQQIMGKLPEISLGDSNTLHCKLNTFADEEIDFEPMRTKERELTLPLKNTLNWMNAKMNKANSPKEARELILQQIKFELNHYKILRLDDQLELLGKLMGNKIEQSMVTEQKTLLLQEVAAIELNQVALAQVTLQDSTTVDFCQHHQLDTLLDLVPYELERGLIGLLRMVELDGHIGHYKKYKNLGFDFNELIDADQISFNKVKDAFQQVVDRLSSLMSIDNFNSFSDESQKTLCGLITQNKIFFDQGAEVFSEYSDGIEEKLSQAFELAELHLSGFGKGIHYDSPDSHDIIDHDDNDEVFGRGLK